MSRRFLLLVNPAAGGGRALDRLPTVEAELARLGAEHRTVQTTDMRHAEDEARAAAAAGETVAAMGGDGLLRPIVASLRDGSVPLAIIPGGRGNDYARVLGISEDPVEATRTAVEGRERLLDVAEVDGTPYMGIASFGFDSDANRIANEARLVRGNLVYAYAAFRAMATWKNAGFTVTVDGERHQLSGFSVAVANSRAFGGGMFLAPQAELDDGVLDIVAICGRSKLRYLRGLPGVFKGKHLDNPMVNVLRGAEIDVASDRPFVIYADGDPIGATPATIEVRKQCLRVVVPG